MIRYRVTVLTRDETGHDWCRIEGPFETRAAAGRYAADAQEENPLATVDVVAIGDYGQLPGRDHPARTDASDKARDAVLEAARRLRKPAP